MTILVLLLLTLDSLGLMLAHRVHIDLVHDVLHLLAARLLPLAPVILASLLLDPVLLSQVGGMLVLGDLKNNTKNRFLCVVFKMGL